MVFDGEIRVNVWVLEFTAKVWWTKLLYLVLIHKPEEMKSYGDVVKLEANVCGYSAP